MLDKYPRNTAEPDVISEADEVDIAIGACGTVCCVVKLTYEPRLTCPPKSVAAATALYL